MRVLVSPGDEVIICPPTVQFYSFYANLAGARVVEVPRNPNNLEVQADEIISAMRQRTKLIVLGSPNNPTGNTISSTDLVKLLKTGAVVLVDESFYEFAGVSVASLVTEFDNLVVTRSFSHWAGLAGMRIAYGLFSQKVLSHVWKLRAAYKVNVAQQLAAEAALDDMRFYQSTLNWVRNERGRLFRQLRKLNFLQPYPSQANFILCKVLRGDAYRIKKRLEKQGVFVRYIDLPDLPHHLRISVGRPEDTDVLMRSLLAMAEEI
jgi:histidinol-phosphate aminotransferase